MKKMLPVVSGAGAAGAGRCMGSAEGKHRAQVHRGSGDYAKRMRKGEKEVKRVDTAKAKVVPGDIVIFSTYYTNIGSKPAANVMITNPVPEHMVYMDRSAEGKGTTIEFSVNGGKSYSAPDKLSRHRRIGKIPEGGGFGLYPYQVDRKQARGAGRQRRRLVQGEVAITCLGWFKLAAWTGSVISGYAKIVST